MANITRSQPRYCSDTETNTAQKKEKGRKQELKHWETDRQYIDTPFENLHTLLSPGAFLAEGVRIFTFPAIWSSPNSLTGTLDNSKE